MSIIVRGGPDEDQLVRSCLPLVQYIVSDIAASLPRQVVRDDLISAALLGLAQAARSWDPDRGVTFEHYARMRMRGAVLDELRGRDWASRSVRAAARRVAAATEQLTASLGRTPSRPEIADLLGMTESAVTKITNDVHRATVLNYDSIFTDGDAGESLMSRDRGPAEVVADKETYAHLRLAVRSLPARLRFVVESYFVEGRLMQDIADELGVTESRVSQMRAEALDLMRETMAAHLEPELLAVPPANARVARRKATYRAAVAAAGAAG